MGDACRPLAARGAPAGDAAAQAPEPGQAHTAAPAHVREAHAHGAAHDSGLPSSMRIGEARGRGAAAARGLARGARDGARAGVGGGGSGGGGGRRGAAAAATASEQELHCRLLIDCMVRECVCSLACRHACSRQGMSTAAAGGVPALLCMRCREQASLCCGVVGACDDSAGATCGHAHVVALPKMCAWLPQGHWSPIVKQMRQGRKPEGICIVCGSCAAGFPPEQNRQRPACALLAATVSFILSISFWLEKELTCHCKYLLM